jgi:hypothetical protein
VGTAVFHADRRTDGQTDGEADRHDEANSRFLQFFERAWKHNWGHNVHILRKGKYPGICSYALKLQEMISLGSFHPNMSFK